MTNDPDKPEDGERPRAKKSIPEETIKQIRNIYFGDVGYKRPPKETRFKKGQSGNPKGRPKTLNLNRDSDWSANAIVLKEGERLISVREGNEIRDMPVIEAVVRKQFGTALGGNAYAQKQAITGYRWAERERRQKIAEEVELYARYVKVTRAEIAEAKAKGKPIPEPFLHPDDIIVDPEQGVTFLCPLTEEGRALLEGNKRWRDVLIMQCMIDQRMAENSDGADVLDCPGSAALAFAQLLNKSLPERHRLSDMRFVIRMDHYDTWSKRKLLKEVYRAWRALGVRVRRGQTFPPLRFTIRAIDEMIEYLTDKDNEDIATFAELPLNTKIDLIGIGRRKFREERI
jgi:hypothetical protein